jgi:WD40 repeat protein
MKAGTAVESSQGSAQIWVLDLSLGTLLQLTPNSPSWEYSPRWSPDGQQILYDSNREYAIGGSPGEFFAKDARVGLGEAGFFPGILLYLTSWFRLREQAQAIAMFTSMQVGKRIAVISIPVGALLVIGKIFVG